MAEVEARQDFLPMELPEIPERDLLSPDEELSRKHTAAHVSEIQYRRECILRAIRSGLSFNVICQVFRIGPSTLSVFTRRHPEYVEAGKKGLAEKFRVGAHLAAEAAMEAVRDGKMPAASLPVMAGIFSDKSQQLDGEPGLVVEHRHTIDPAMLAKQAQAWVNEALPVSALPDNELGAGDAVSDAVGDVPDQPAGDDPAGDSEQEGGGGRRFSGGCG